jgi:hypothetical protein
MTIQTRNWDVETYRSKLEKIVSQTKLAISSKYFLSFSPVSFVSKMFMFKNFNVKQSHRSQVLCLFVTEEIMYSITGVSDQAPPSPYAIGVPNS